MLWIAKATFSLSALRTAHRLTEYPRHYCGHCMQCCIISPLYTESKTLMKTLKMKMSHLTLLLQQTQVAMLNASSLFHNTLLNKINNWIKLHVRFIDNKIRKRMKTFNAINLINPFILFFWNLWWLHFMAWIFLSSNMFKLQVALRIFLFIDVCRW